VYLPLKPGARSAAILMACGLYNVLLGSYIHTHAYIMISVAEFRFRLPKCFKHISITTPIVPASEIFRGFNGFI
jgi:hypothetical protein